jgi:glutamyl-Q tRNA(Asp) synthetase
MPEGQRLSWVDRLAGEQCHDSDDISDVIIKRADGHWAYHLAVVIDDAAQGITHVVRGADLLDSTPIHLALQRALGLNPLTYAHIPLVVNDQGQKLSKQTMALPVEVDEKEDIVKQVLTHLGMDDIQSNTLSGLLDEGLAWWRKARL